MVKAGSKAAPTAAPGKALIRFTAEYNGVDFGGESKRFYPGDEMEVDATLAAGMARDHGAGCPFEIVSENKAIGGAPETK
jgi:hypothetical protein